MNYPFPAQQPTDNKLPATVRVSWLILHHYRVCAVGVDVGRTIPKFLRRGIFHKSLIRNVPALVWNITSFVVSILD